MDFISSIATIIISGAFSVAASLFTAKKATQHELVKMGYQYEHDDNAQLKEAYAKMHSTILIYIDCTTPPRKREALTALSELITISPAELRQDLQLLQEALTQSQSFSRALSVSDINKIKDILKTLDDIWATRSLTAQKKGKGK